jgi:uncharacterized membrane protein
VTGALARVSVDDTFNKQVLGKATPGTSALFLYTLNEGPDGSPTPSRTSASTWS